MCTAHDFDARALHALSQVLYGGARSHHHVGFDFQAEAVHTQWIAHAGLSIDRVTAGNDVDQFLVLRQHDGACRFQHAIHVIGHNAAIAPGDADHALAVT